MYNAFSLCMIDKQLKKGDLSMQKKGFIIILIALVATMVMRGQTFAVDDIVPNTVKESTLAEGTMEQKRAEEGGTVRNQRQMRLNQENPEYKGQCEKGEDYQEQRKSHIRKRFRNTAMKRYSRNGAHRSTMGCGRMIR